MLDHFGVANEGGIEDFDCSAFAELGDTEFRGDAGEIVGKGDVEGDAEVGFDSASGGSGTTKSDFFLSCSDSIDVNIVRFGGLDGFDHDENSAAVIH